MFLSNVRDSTEVIEMGLKSHGKLFTHICLYSPSSINWYWHKLGAKQALHATHWPRVHGLAASASVWLRALEMEISAALRTLPQHPCSDSDMLRRLINCRIIIIIIMGPCGSGRT